MQAETTQHGFRELVVTVRESLSGRQHDYTAGPLRRAILLLAIPMILEMVMESVFAICDIFFVARVGIDAVATVGLTESVLMLIYAVAIGLAMATTAMVSRRIGEKDEKAASVAGMQAIYLGLVLGLLIGIPGWLFAPRLLELMGAQASVVFALLPSWGLANAAATLVGQNLGARRPDRAERAVWLTGLYNMVFLGLVTVAFVAAAPWLVAVFTDDGRIAPVAEASLRIISYGYVFYAWGMVLTQAFNGAGDTTTPTWINLFCFWMLQIPLAWFLAGNAGLGPRGVFWAVAIAESVVAVTAAVIFRRGKWKAREV